MEYTRENGPDTKATSENSAIPPSLALLMACACFPSQRIRVKKNPKKKHTNNTNRRYGLKPRERKEVANNAMKTPTKARNRETNSQPKPLTSLRISTIKQLKKSIKNTHKQNVLAPSIYKR